MTIVSDATMIAARIETVFTAVSSHTATRWFHGRFRISVTLGRDHGGLAGKLKDAKAFPGTVKEWD